MNNELCDGCQIYPVNRKTLDSIIPGAGWIMPQYIPQWSICEKCRIILKAEELKAKELREHQRKIAIKEHDIEFKAAKRFLQKRNIQS